LRDRRDGIGQIAKYCNGIIYVDNPSVDIEIEEGISEKMKRSKIRDLEAAREKREDSREILLGHFEKNAVER
jgi:hypothetical protein